MALRRLLGELDFPFHSASAAETRRSLAIAETLLDRYLLPRLGREGTPLRIAMAGPTGAGKSMLVNAVAGKVVSAPGVLRPTTRIPVLISHPDDERWLAGQDEFGEPMALDGLAEHQSAAEIPPGVILVDMPPLDSVRGSGRAAVSEALTGADAWVFVTTAARYADAVPWELLDTAATRSIFVAVVINRVPSGAISEIQTHMSEMLTARSLGDVPLFAVEEATLDSSGMLSQDMVAPLATWLRELSAVEARTAVRRHTLDGAVTSLVQRVTATVAGAAKDVFDDATRASLLDSAEAVRQLWKGRE